MSVIHMVASKRNFAVLHSLRRGIHMQMIIKKSLHTDAPFFQPSVHQYQVLGRQSAASLAQFFWLERYAYTESSGDAMADRMIRPPVRNYAEDDLRVLLERAMERIYQLERAMERMEGQLLRLELRLSDVAVQCSDRDANIGRIERLLDEVADCVTDLEYA